MKKLFAVSTAVLTSVAALSGCGAKDDKYIRIQFVPSNLASTITTNLNTIQAFLKAEMPEYTFDLSVGTSYNGVVEGMSAKQIDVGFLTAQQYAQATIERPGEIDVMLTSVRKGYQVQFDFPGDYAKQLEYMNTSAYHGEQATEDVTYYNSICITKKDSSINGVKDLAGRTVAVQGTSSGAGYVYPSKLLYDNNMKFVTGTPDASKGEVKAQQILGYPAAVTAVLNGDVDAAWIFHDVRYANFYSTGADLEIFNKTKAVAMTTGIYNDTISVIKSMPKATREALNAAFMKMVSDQNSDVAKAIYAVYSHTGYKAAADKDYEGERDVYKFKRDVLNKA